jgi:hypothetical protein
LDHQQARDSADGKPPSDRQCRYVFVAYRLSQKGWNVMPTSRNARGIDLLAYDAPAGRYLGIQVKALSELWAVSLGQSIDHLMGDWWIIVAKAATNPECFIMTTDEVRRSAHHNKNKNGQISYWLEKNDYNTDEYCEGWHRIGRGDSSTVDNSQPPRQDMMPIPGDG